ncbi:MAG: AAA family ATPase [Symploca sp. SIO2D2]|nr:AAA family ATPase [Symploca sp. SIO2D2]
MAIKQIKLDGIRTDIPLKGIVLIAGESATLTPSIVENRPWYDSGFVHYSSGRYAQVVIDWLDPTTSRKDPDYWWPDRGMMHYEENCFRRFWEWYKEREDIENELNFDTPGYRDYRLEAVRQVVLDILGVRSLRIRRGAYKVVVGNGGSEVDYNHLPQGDRCLIAMLGDMVRNFIEGIHELNPFESEYTVLIDEIELHLPPKRQHGLIDKLTKAFPKCQFILTTNSPIIVGQVKPERVFVVGGSGGWYHPEESYGREYQRILVDLFGTDERLPHIKQGLLEMFRLIDAGKLDEGRELRHQLAGEIGGGDSSFVKADMLIRRKELIGK